ncbi:hypothetical protein [Bacillus sp. B15-48]|uniref:hypothetical protein n=1 Tax=Bacillus sp. B15-48 TaxID=1548601 RepID=UPI001EF16ED9|nr:hypothetical protein [Bacillus sp. B15-48]
MLLGEEMEIQDRKEAVKTVPVGDIEFKVKEFAYPGEQEPQLRGINFSLSKGAT